MDGKYNGDLLSEGEVREVTILLRNMARDFIFNTEIIYRLEATESTILNYLLSEFVNAVIWLDTEYEDEMRLAPKRLVSFISDNYKKVYYRESKDKSEREKLNLRLVLVTDYICGMTDSYAKRLYQELRAMPVGKGNF